VQLISIEREEPKKLFEWGRINRQIDRQTIGQTNR
jgi:hypothetical protein